MRYKKQRIPLATKAASGRSVPLTAELLVNMYAEAAPAGARNSVVGIGCPGLSLFSSISTDWGSYIRGLYYVPGNNTLWCVVGLTLYKISSTGVATSIGTIGGYGRVGMADNGVELVIVAESIGYIVTLASDTLAAITDSDYPNADTVAFLKSYFLFNNNQSGSKGQLYWSSSYGGLTYDALDFATAESQSDNLVAVWRDHDRVLLFGTHTTEPWFASGDADAVFAPYSGATINRGLGARWSIANIDNRVIFLDNEGVVRVADAAGTRISTHAIEYEIAKGSWRHDDANAYDGAVASSYVEEGHEFYVLTVPGTGTFVYDAATGLWHKRKSRGLEHSRSSFHVHAFGKVICGDTETGKLYDQSLAYYGEADEYLVAEIQFPPIHNNGERFRVHEIELIVESAPSAGTVVFGASSTIPTPSADDFTTSSFGIGSVDPTVTEAGDSVVISHQAAGGHEATASFATGSNLGGRFVARMKLSNITLPLSTGDRAVNVGPSLGLGTPITYTNEIYSSGTLWGINEGNQSPRTTGIGPAIPAEDEWFVAEVAFDDVGNRTYKIDGVAYHTESSAVSETELSYRFYMFQQSGDMVVDYVFFENADGEIFLPGGQAAFGVPPGGPNIMLDALGCGNRVPDITQSLRHMGGTGEHCKRIIWRRLGQHRTFTPRFTISDPVKRVVIDATARISWDG